MRLEENTGMDKKELWIGAAILGVANIFLIGTVMMLVLNGNFWSNNGKTGSLSGEFEPNAESYFKENREYDYADNIIAGTGAASDKEEAAEKRDIPDTDFIFPDSSSSLISRQQMEALLIDKLKCQRAMNEIFARYGCRFDKVQNLEDYQYFNSLEWYGEILIDEGIEEITGRLSGIEKKNIETINSYMVEKGWQ